MQSHKESAKNFLHLIIAGKFNEAYETYIADDFVHHNAYTKAGRAELKKGMEENHLLFPNKIFEIKRVIEEGDLVAIHSHMKLDSTKDLAVVHIFRFENDRVVELWDIGQMKPEEQVNEAGIF